MREPEVFIDLHILFLKDGCVLMGKRLNTVFGAGQYHLPAGRLEADETMVDGAIREAREETGVALTAEALELAYVMHFRGDSDRLSLFFQAEGWRGRSREPRAGKVRRLDVVRNGPDPRQHCPLRQEGTGGDLCRAALGPLRLALAR